MQINTYISTKDFETLSKAKPKQFKTVGLFMADVIHERAVEEERRQAYFTASGLPAARKTFNAQGEPIIPQYERQ